MLHGVGSGGAPVQPDTERVLVTITAWLIVLVIISLLILIMVAFSTRWPR